MARGPTDLARSAAATAFGALSVLRGGRSLHPDGVAFRTTVAVDPDPPGLASAELFSHRRERKGVIRLSRSLGLPEALPDIYGAALRVLDAYGPGLHQDLMLVTGGEGAAARHLFTPARDYRGRTLSTVLPYRVGGRLWVFLLRLRDATGAPDRVGTRAEVAAAGRAGRLTFDLSIAPVLGGPPRRLARIDAIEPLPAEEEGQLRFDTDHTGGGLEPAGFPNRLRPAAYHASQAARPTFPGRSPRGDPTGPRTGAG